MPRQLTRPRRQLIAEVRRLLGPDADDLLGSDAHADRLVEGWRAKAAGLGPLVDHGPVDDAPHYAALVQLAGRGTVADSTALRLARRGFACRRYGLILWRTWGLERAEGAPVDPYGAGEYDHLDLASALVDDLEEPSGGSLDSLWRDLLAGVRRQVDKERQVEATMNDMVALAMGGLPIVAANPVGGDWPHTSPHVQPWGLDGGPSPLVQVAIVVEHYLPEVVVNIPVAEAVLSATGTSLRGDDLGDLAALLAPMQVLWTRRYRAAMQAWGQTGGAWSVAFDESTPQLAMAAEQVHPLGDENLAPPGQDGLVVEVGVGSPPDGPRDERLVLRSPPSPRGGAPR